MLTVCGVVSLRPDRTEGEQMSRVAIIKEEWVRHSDVGPDELAVLCVLALHANKDGVCWPTQGLLAELLGRSRPWVNKVIGRLVEIGLVQKTHRTRDDGGDRACLYRLVDDTVDSSGDTGSHAYDSVTTKPESKQDSPRADTPIVVELDLKTPDERWQPSDSDLCWAIDRFPTADLQANVDRFVSRCRAKGYRYRDLGAAWRSWLADDERQSSPVRPNGKHQGPAHARFAAWAGVAAKHYRGYRHAA